MDIDIVFSASTDFSDQYLFRSHTHNHGSRCSFPNSLDSTSPIRRSSTQIPPCYLHQTNYSSDSMPNGSWSVGGPSSTFNTLRTNSPDSNLVCHHNSPNCTKSNEQLNVSHHIHFPILLSSQTQRIRRNSSGSESRMRRHSAAPIHTVASAINTHRQRRRSHDARDEQGDLLERLHFVATRRRSLSAPFQSSLRTQNN